MKEFKSNRAYREECEALRAQVAALTKERDAALNGYAVRDDEVTGLIGMLKEARDQLAAAQAWEAKLRDALDASEEYWMLGNPSLVKQCQEALALPTDDSALQARLKAERERWEHAANEWADTATNAKAHIENIRDGISTLEHALENLAECFKHNHEVVDAIRSMI